MKKYNCPHCKTNLKKENIGYAQKGEMTYRISLASGLNGIHLQEAELDYEVDEFHTDSGGEFYCRECGKALEIDEKTVKQILKG